MSVFGDHTPEQDLLDWIQYVQSEHKLTLMQLLRALSVVMEWLTRNGE